MNVSGGVRIAILSVVGAVAALDSAGQPPERPLAEAQQAELAKDLLSGDPARRDPAVAVAAALGPSRMSEDVRSAFITLLGELNLQVESAHRSGAATSTVVDPESMMAVARTVADLRDARAIPALSRIAYLGYSEHVTAGLASFGEEALPAVLAVIDEPGVPGEAIANSLRVLTRMVSDAGPPGLSQGARERIVAVARRSLSGRNVLSVLSAMELAVALDEPELVRAVTRFSEAPNELRARGLENAEVDLIQKSAARAIRK